MGGAPPPRLAAREHTPLSPTMQLSLHIFSHFPIPTPSAWPRSPVQRALSALRAALRDRPRQCKSGCIRRGWEASCSCGLAPGHVRDIRSPPPRGRRRKERPLPSDLPPTARPRRISTRRRLAALAVTALAAAIAGCGSSHPDGTEADPATAVPAAAPVYLGATVRPTGSQRTGALAAGKDLTHQADPYLRLLGALRTPGSPALDFKQRRGVVAGPSRRAVPQLAELGRSAAQHRSGTPLRLRADHGAPALRPAASTGRS